eukprot:CAMPEP_0179072604 /NCGR_PEP_ID=MMETSP0796-20121207/32142_1 /TAXON_ID=73915 /ORGANISM="Pyrodinium bahamense, Strain pbaha01" /LENGTH=326 /DNA_ID=CAMNT_0020769773 /DNA_START=63 /DNA_END=1040 /DNA_ORIENTATION=-
MTVRTAYTKSVDKHLLVEGCLVHGYHVHPRRLDGIYIEKEQVMKMVDCWLDLRVKGGNAGTDAELAAFADLQERAEKYVQFKIILSELAESNYRQIGISSRIASIGLTREKDEPVHVAAARYIETRFPAEVVQAASVRLLDPGKYALTRLPYVHNSCSIDEVKQVIDTWLGSRTRSGKGSPEEQAAVAVLQQRCAQNLHFKVGLSKLYAQDYRGLSASATIDTMRLRPAEGGCLALAAAREPGAPQFSHPLLGEEATGEYIYVIKSGLMYVAEKADDVQHTSFFGVHEPVESSGWIRLSHGTLVGYRRWSGHFLPGAGSEAVFQEW